MNRHRVLQNTGLAILQDLVRRPSAPAPMMGGTAWGLYKAIFNVQFVSQVNILNQKPCVILFSFSVKKIISTSKRLAELKDNFR